VLLLDFASSIKCFTDTEGSLITSKRLFSCGDSVPESGSSNGAGVMIDEYILEIISTTRQNKRQSDAAVAKTLPWV
jgi:hypothetical protein